MILGSGPDPAQSLDEAVSKAFETKDPVAFVRTYLHLRRADRHLRRLNGLRRDLHVLDTRLARASNKEQPVLKEIRSWLEEEYRTSARAVEKENVMLRLLRRDDPVSAGHAEKAVRRSLGR